MLESYAELRSVELFHGVVELSRSTRRCRRQCNHHRVTTPVFVVLICYSDGCTSVYVCDLLSSHLGFLQLSRNVIRHRLSFSDELFVHL